MVWAWWLQIPVLKFHGITYTRVQRIDEQPSERVRGRTLQTLYEHLLRIAPSTQNWPMGLEGRKDATETTSNGTQFSNQQFKQPIQQRKPCRLDSPIRFDPICFRFVPMWIYDLKTIHPATECETGWGGRSELIGWDSDYTPEAEDNVWWNGVRHRATASIKHHPKALDSYERQLRRQYRAYSHSAVRELYYLVPRSEAEDAAILKAERRSAKRSASLKLERRMKRHRR